MNGTLRAVYAAFLVIVIVGSLFAIYNPSRPLAAQVMDILFSGCTAIDPSGLHLHCERYFVA